METQKNKIGPSIGSPNGPRLFTNPSAMRITNLISLHRPSHNPGNLNHVHHHGKIMTGDMVMLLKAKHYERIMVKGGYGCETTLDHKEPTDVMDDGILEQHHTYICYFREPLEMFHYKDNPIHFRFRLDTELVGSGYQCWYPSGGLWYGLSEDGETWYHHEGQSPFDLLSPQTGYKVPDLELGLHTIEACTEDSKIYTTLDYVNYLYVHIRCCSTLFWTQHCETHLKWVNCCYSDMEDEILENPCLTS